MFLLLAVPAVVATQSTRSFLVLRTGLARAIAGIVKRMTVTTLNRVQLGAGYSCILVGALGCTGVGIRLATVSSCEIVDRRAESDPEVEMTVLLDADEKVEVGYDDGFVFVELVYPEAPHPVCARLSATAQSNRYRVTMAFPRAWLPDWPEYECAIRLVKHRTVPLFSRSVLSNTVEIGKKQMVESFGPAQPPAVPSR